MIKAQHIDREAIDVRSIGDSRTRVDAYFVSYQCPPDSVNPGAGPHEWVCRFEVPRGQSFKMQNFPNKDAAKAARGFVI